MYGINLNEITVTNRYGYAILTDEGTGRAMVCEPTMAGPNIIAFVILERCDSYEDAHLVALGLHTVLDHADDDVPADDEPTPVAAIESPPTVTG